MRQEVECIENSIRSALSILNLNTCTFWLTQGVECRPFINATQSNSGSTAWIWHYVCKNISKPFEISLKNSVSNCCFNCFDLRLLPDTPHWQTHINQNIIKQFALNCGLCKLPFKSPTFFLIALYMVVRLRTQFQIFFFQKTKGQVKVSMR